MKVQGFVTRFAWKTSGIAVGGLLIVAGASCFQIPNSRGQGGTATCETPIPPPILSSGSASAQSTTCASSGLPGADCYELTVSCPEVGQATAMLKHHPSTTQTVGTIILTSGGGGTSLYEDAFTHGPDLITDLNDAGYDTVQVVWDRGWSNGPGGVARLACRYASVARWIYDEIHQGGEAQPFCATGNSGGSAQIAYSMTRFETDDIFDAVVPTSGPPVARLDLGCACEPGSNTSTVPCGEATLCYDENRLADIDTSYVDSPCQDGCLELLEADSVVAAGVDLNYPNTSVVAVFGSQDNSNAIAQAMQWYNAITSDVEVICVPEAGHSVAASIEGYEMIRDQLLATCVP